MEIIRKRADFVALNGKTKVSTPGFTLLARDRGDNDDGVRVGFTCSKKVGNAVERNLAKRRLREAARAVIPDRGQAGWDYVLIGRAGVTAELPLSRLKSDIEAAVAGLIPAPETAGPSC